MKKNIVKKFCDLIFAIILFSSFFISGNAAAGGRCTCKQYVEHDVCNCDIICPSMFVTPPGGSAVPLREVACTTSPGGVLCECTTQRSLLTDTPEQCTSICSTNISDPSYGTKRGSGIGEFQAVPGEGEACDRDAECAGEGCPIDLISGRSGCDCYSGIEDYPSETEYRASGSRGSCSLKNSPGDPCVRNGQCLSNICDSASGRCADETGRAPTTTGGTTTGGTATEEEVFPTYHINSPIGEVTGPQLIGRIIKTVLTLVGALALAMFVYGGFTWLTSGGSPDKIKKGKDILMWATIGLIVVFSSYTLVDFLLKSFGL